MLIGRNLDIGEFLRVIYMKSIILRISIIDYLHKVNWHYYLKFGYFFN